jgi:hypothetical protein
MEREQGENNADGEKSCIGRGKNGVESKSEAERVKGVVFMARSMCRGMREKAFSQWGER